MLLSDVCLTSDVCLSVAYIGNNSRTVRPRKTTGSPRHTWLGYHFQGQKVTGAGHIVAASRLQLVIAEKAIMFTLRAKLYCNRPCLFVCLFVGPTYKLIQPARSVCVASERVFHFICVCLFVYLSVNSKTTHQILMKFYGMVGCNPGTNRLDFEWPWPNVKVIRGQKVKIVYANDSVQNCIESRDKNENLPR